MEQKEDQREKTNWDVRPYLAVALLVFLVFCLCLAVFFIVYRYSEFQNTIQTIMNVLQPVIIGLALAYVLNPLVNRIDTLLKRFIKNEKMVRSLSTCIVEVIGLVIVIGLISMVVPELVTSIEKLSVSLPGQADNFVKWSNEMIKSDNHVIQYGENLLLNTTDYVENWLKEELLPQTQIYIASITTGIISVIKGFMNVFIGIIISIYVLLQKEQFIGQAKKLIYAMFRPKVGNKIIVVMRKSNDIFGGFISGKLVDSLIMGILCYISLLVLRMPYALLVSVIVGVTNVIPFFGPYIGAVPTTLLITLSDPIKGLYFVIFIIILQQVDGNIIGPKILSNSTGLTSFWIVFAILLGGGLFGIPGMILGVPAFAVIYYLCQELIRYSLRRRSLPEESSAYVEIHSISPVDNHIRYKEEVKKVSKFREQIHRKDKKEDKEKGPEKDSEQDK